ncbi:HNH endonuclease [Sporosarcina siberiensis]|uniref:HNH endonuclease n=1 Tax=Sporosarcina siberiensis TaxID=1365606 RepID=A0ABW4SH97_9BACL
MVCCCFSHRYPKIFINEQLNKPFVEGHHLVPMFTQTQFENTIDFADNIVTLCPNCHREIHYGLQVDKSKMVKILFANRKDLFHKYGIEITIKKLLSFYKVEEKYE